MAEQGTLSQIIEGNPVATVVIDAEHRVTQWNRACEVLTGVTAAEMIGSRLQWRPFYPNPRPIMADLIVDGALSDEICRYYEGKYRPSALIEGAYEAEDFFPAFGDGGRWLFFTAAPLRDGSGQVIGAIETLQDVTDRRRAEAALKEREAILAQILEGSSVATFVIDEEHRLSHWNRACEVLTGVPARCIIGTREHWRAFYPAERPCMADIILDGADEVEVQQFYGTKYQPSRLIEGAYEAEDFFPALGERGRWVYFTAAPLRDQSGKVIGAIETLQDVSERHFAEEALKESEERYRLLSVTDALTGLFNSRHFYDRLQTEVERAERYRRPLTLAVIDADNFKHINDTFGHLQGDKVLQVLAGAIRESLRRTDSAYRYGGEEFVILMPEATLEAGTILAERLRRQYAATEISAGNGTLLHCTISIGVAQYLPGETPRNLVRRADEGTYQAKQRGKNCVVAVELPNGF